MAKSKIEWTGTTYNPITGCTKVSEGCRNCYALTMSRRLAAMGQPKYQGVVDGDKWTGTVRWHWDALEKVPRDKMVFVNSMSDTFYPDVPDEFLAHLFAEMQKRENTTFQVLTKRPERAIAILARQAGYMSVSNIWIGTSVEDQKTADERIPLLLQIPAAVHFVSAEPLLGPLDFVRWMNITYAGDGHVPVKGCAAYAEKRPAIDWVIVGCESGPNRRPMDIEWARSIKNQCVAAEVPFFLKQVVVSGKVVKMPILDGCEWDQMPTAKGG